MFLFLFQALAEKQMLIRHLEAIEADMLEREAGFEEMEKEKGLSEFTWQQKMMQVCYQLLQFDHFSKINEDVFKIK